MIKRGDLNKYALLPELALGSAVGYGVKKFVDTRVKPYSKRYHPAVVGRMYNLDHRNRFGKETGIDDEELGKKIQHDQSEFDGTLQGAIDHGQPLLWGSLAGLGTAALTGLMRG